MKLTELTEIETLNPPSISVGDEVKVGKFLNRKAEVRGFKTDDKGQPVLKTTKGDQKLYKPRVSKLEPDYVEEADTKIDFGIGKEEYKNVIRKLQAKEISGQTTATQLKNRVMKAWNKGTLSRKLVNRMLKGLDVKI